MHFLLLTFLLVFVFTLLYCVFFLLLIYDQYYYYTLLWGNIYINTNTNISVITPVLQILSTCIGIRQMLTHTHFLLSLSIVSCVVYALEA